MGFDRMSHRIMTMNAEPKIAIPVNIYAYDMTLNTCTDSSISCLLSRRNRTENGYASTSEKANIISCFTKYPIF